MRCWTCWREWPTATPASLLNLVEYVAALPEDKRDLEQIKAALPEVLVRHDKDGDSHYELASALIKSIRGSDVDAALYYLACLLEGGEDPRFVCRRLILSASEDVGLADPRRSALAVACQQAVEFVGMPEGFIPLAETVVYLALARKSNASYAAYLNAAREVKAQRRTARPPASAQSFHTNAEGMGLRQGIQISPQLPRFLGGTALSAARTGGQALLPAARQRRGAAPFPVVAQNP